MNLLKIRLPKLIVPILVFAVVLNISRIFLFGTHSFFYLLWNIFLAVIPFIISSIISLYINKKNFYNPIFIFGFVLWILFLPNAPYVVTDFIHLGEIRSVPVMYDIIILFVSAIVSLIFGLYSLEQVENIFLIKFSKKTTNITIFIIILFTSFGIYLGRTLRFNSWDLFFNHNSLFGSILNIFTNPDKHFNAYFFTIIFFFLIYTSFLAFKNRKS